MKKLRADDPYSQPGRLIPAPAAPTDSSQCHPAPARDALPTLHSLPFSTCKEQVFSSLILAPEWITTGPHLPGKVSNMFFPPLELHFFPLEST